MKALVVYDSKFGNTRQIAQTIGDVLAEQYTVSVIPAAEAVPVPEDLDLLVVGGPTHAHGASAGMKAFLAATTQAAHKGMPAAAFDTRFHMARWLSGSAAGVIGKRLHRADYQMVMPPESFFVDREKEPQMLPGEEERVRTWAHALLAAAPASVPQPART